MLFVAKLCKSSQETYLNRTVIYSRKEKNEGMTRQSISQDFYIGQRKPELLIHKHDGLADGVTEMGKPRTSTAQIKVQ